MGMSTESGIQESREPDSECRTIQGPGLFTASLRSLEAVLKDADIGNIANFFERILKEGPLVGSVRRGLTRDNLCLRSVPGSCLGLSLCTRSSCASTTVAGSSLSLRSVAGEDSLHSHHSTVTDEPCVPAINAVYARLGTRSKPASNLKSVCEETQEGQCTISGGASESKSKGTQDDLSNNAKDTQDDVSKNAPEQPVLNAHEEERCHTEENGESRIPNLQNPCDEQCGENEGDKAVSGLLVTRIQRRSPRLQRTGLREPVEGDSESSSIGARDKQQGASPLQQKRQYSPKRPAGSSKRQSSREGRNHHALPVDPGMNTTRPRVSIKSKRRKNECIDTDNSLKKRCMDGNTTRGRTPNEIHMGCTELSPSKEKGAACRKGITSERTSPISSIGVTTDESASTTKKECEGDSARANKRKKVISSWKPFENVAMKVEPLTKASELTARDAELTTTVDEAASDDEDDGPICTAVFTRLKLQTDRGADATGEGSSRFTGLTKALDVPAEAEASSSSDLCSDSWVQDTSQDAGAKLEHMLQHKVLRPLPPPGPQFDFGLFVVRVACISKHADDVFPLLEDNELMENSVVLKKYMASCSSGTKRGDAFMFKELVADIPNNQGAYTPSVDITEAPWCSREVRHSSCGSIRSAKEILLKQIEKQKTWNPFSIFGSSPPSVELEDVFGFDVYKDTAPSARVQNPLFRRLSQFASFKDLYASLSKEEWDRVSSAFHRQWNKQCLLDLDWTNDPLTVGEIMWMLEANGQVEDRSSDVYDAEVCFCVTPNPKVGFGWNDPRCHKYKAPRPSMGGHLLTQVTSSAASCEVVTQI